MLTISHAALRDVSQGMRHDPSMFGPPLLRTENIPPIRGPHMGTKWSASASGAIAIDCRQLLWSFHRSFPVSLAPMNSLRLDPDWLHCRRPPAIERKQSSDTTKRRIRSQPADERRNPGDQWRQGIEYARWPYSGTRRGGRPRGGGVAVNCGQLLGSLHRSLPYLVGGFRTSFRSRLRITSWRDALPKRADPAIATRTHRDRRGLGRAAIARRDLLWSFHGFVFLR
jgi:hypothetical protein